MAEASGRLVETSSGRIEIIDFDPDHRVQIVNPNPWLVYRDTVGRKEFFFEPFKTYEVKESIANMLVTRADNLWKQQKLNEQSCRQHWAQCISSMNMIMKDMAKKFCDPRYPVEEGVPIVKVWPRPGLVRLDTPVGDKYFSEGEQFALKASEKDVEEYKEKYAAFLWERKAEGLNKPVKPIEEEIEAESPPLLDAILEIPKDTWEEEQKIGYISRFSQAEPKPPKRDRDEWLNKEMQRVYSKTKQRWSDAGVVFREQ
jgi:hypothetical protein